MSYSVEVTLDGLARLELDIAEGERRTGEIFDLLAEGRWRPSELAALLELVDALHRVVSELRDERSRLLAAARDEESMPQGEVLVPREPERTSVLRPIQAVPLEPTWRDTGHEVAAPRRRRTGS